MNKDLIPLELAQKLFDKGMPKPNNICFGSYKDGKATLFKIIGPLPERMLAPSIEQVLEWLRKEKKIHIATGVTPKSSWRYVIMFCNERGLEEPTIIKKNYHDYPSAIIAGIEYVIDNLI